MSIKGCPGFHKATAWRSVRGSEQLIQAKNRIWLIWVVSIGLLCGCDQPVDEIAQTSLVQQIGPVEIVPTPPPDKKIVKPELIPTPPGVPIAMDSQKQPSGGQKAPPVPKTDGPEDFATWAKPDVALFITGQQHGYIEPCGCTGLDKQKGGVARRMTFMKQLQDKGWDLVPIDAGNQIRRTGQQASIKFVWATEALKQMKYQLVGFGPDDMRLDELDLLQVASADSPQNAMYVSGNITLFDPDQMPTFKIVERGGKKIGVTSILDPESITNPLSSDVTVAEVAAASRTALENMNRAGADFRVLSFYGTNRTSEEDAAELMRAVPGYDLIVVAGGYGEPTYKPQAIEDSKCKMIVTGNKGMYVGLVGLYADKPFTYARVPLTHEYGDAAEMRRLMGEYQKQLEALGLDGLGLSPIPHGSGNTYIGSEACKKCHEYAFERWSDSMHSLATEHIVTPTEGRGDVARHFDPECLSCHVTGWDPQGYSPYATGYSSLKASAHLLGNGCENCHGPGKQHAEAEAPDSGASEALIAKLRKAVQLPLDRAREHCMKCHDLDNSPEFGEDDAFEDIYWPEIEHYTEDQ